VEIHDEWIPGRTGGVNLYLCTYLRRFSGASDARRARVELAERLFKLLSDHATPDWPWPEDTITYANGVIPHGIGRVLVRRSRCRSQSS
jgi:hypothetical protein